MNLQSILETLLDQRGDDNPSCTPPVTPKLPSKCPLFCCFYSEFDIKKGPVISYQSPKGLMDQDINISTERIQEMLARTFEEVVERDEAKHIVSLHTTSENKCADIAESYTTSSDALPGTPQSSNIASASSSHPKSIFDTPESLVSSPPAPTTIMHAAGLSIFDSTSEYIITGSELTSKTITLSTHSFHVMTRPTMISNPRYERNAHLFSVGFLLRRAADPNPFRPLLSKLAITLQVMEEESQFLTLPEQRPKLQTLLERVLLALNSSDWECNLLLSRSNVLHLKLYHPPKPDASPVFEHEVPILLRKDSQLQMYDWDLAINWVILHIDGITNARQISLKAEVDLEMVQACLRVLKHHGVIALVSPFSYSNHYEFTPKATAMLAGKEPRLLQEALEFVWKRWSNTLNQQNGSTSHHAMIAGGHTGPMLSPGSASSHPTNNPVIGSPYSYFGFTPSSSSYPPRTTGLSVSHRSARFGVVPAVQSIMDKEPSAPLPGQTGTGDEVRLFRSALAELYCACSQNLSFGDLWLALTTSSPLVPPSGALIPSQQQQKQQQQYGQHPRHPTSYSLRQGSISEDYPDEGPPQQFPTSVLENLALSPSESHNLESLRRTTKKSNKDTTASLFDWNDFFKLIDPRRLVTFGLIHGIITRIHCFPCFPYSFPDPCNAASQFLPSVEATAGSDGRTNDETTATNGNHLSSSTSSRLEEYELAKLTASLMDGTRCDDELACALEVPFRRLVKMVESYSTRKVICLYAARSE